LFNFDTHKGLTVKIYIILVCTRQQWAFLLEDMIIYDVLLVTPVGFAHKNVAHKKNNSKREAAKK